MNGVFPALGGTEGSRSWFERAQASLAGGISSSARLTSTGPHPYPLYMTSGSGARVRDVDGNEYIDYLVSYGSAVLGHASPSSRTPSPTSSVRERCSAPATCRRSNSPS